MISLFFGLLRVLAALLFVRLALRFVAAFLVGLRGSDAPPAKSDGERELVRDRVCNTFLPRASALTLVVDGREEHFCSERCRKQRALAAAS